jgi:maltose alpha-D-glucosyltransferase/alpha-amylase
MKIAFAFLLSMPGAPFIYYGDEIGMRYVEGLTSKEGGYERTGSRTPMQWDDSPNAGFSEADEYDLYLPLDPAADRPTAESELFKADSLLREVKNLIALRQEHTALQSRGEISFISSGYPLVYKRTSADEQILVIINPSCKRFALPLKLNGEVIYTVGGEPEIKPGNVIMPNESAVFIKLNK